MYVECVIPDESGILEKGRVYSVKLVTNRGNFHLNEVLVPKPYTSFERFRFEEIDLEDIDVSMFFDEILGGNVSEIK